ncbi:Extradiol ring-cleavage dioxygenase, class III enzyme, subunit B [Zychaea mexicana]|uniref:Extradiol ring-cleavage dioxygenase, class III enzyme, subunit B n=1 Tax=Zychaea mexicana TaxID=64656 RepID=UPI0022FE6E92|nr:Extradiol ring-cleavage dioxygenase, class III enzyme, subunit B [Zychaea mexicana]KAI9498988.1 Extradiol ring-cleavage dioxygenase, class III enzyme, subunit B [Zychaea mexicana]
MRAPVFFISHGGPNLLEDKEKPGDFYTWFGKYLKKELKPKAIVLISAHWQGTGKNGIYVDNSEKPKLIYDFYNFPQRYYEQTWDQQGSPELAEKVIGLLKKSGINASGQRYGADHGLWVPMKRAMKSNKDIPIIEISTFGHEDMAMHTKMGEALAPLRDEGVVIIGSGSAVHNLRLLWSNMDKPSPQFVVDFDKDMEKIAVGSTGQARKEAANQLSQHGAFRQCHPTAEHLVPFHVALGAAGSDAGVKLLEDYIATLAWGSYGFGLSKDTVMPTYKNVNKMVNNTTTSTSTTRAATTTPAGGLPPVPLVFLFVIILAFVIAQWRS